MRSARLPGSSDPVMSPRCIARAPRRVAMASACTRRECRRIAADALGQERRQPRLLEHVEIVVRRGAVGADPDVEAELDHLRNRRDARPQFQVAGRVVRNARRVRRVMSGFLPRRRGRSAPPGRAHRTAAASSPRERPACRAPCGRVRPRAPFLPDAYGAARRIQTPALAHARKISAVHVYGAWGATEGTISGCPFHFAIKARAVASASS